MVAFLGVLIAPEVPVVVLPVVVLPVVSVLLDVVLRMLPLGPLNEPVLGAP
ncbi:hypothetical protein [Bradyrhizobium sp. LTSP857]|uniref:hypothetical protein n=1 Tax=Bradyrhizobium sp. LTSP857 TaxID=1619231 RepID=UPI0012DFFF28|nr:hypothetical protein [Bradyrhizobium sp. LTSP857]